MPTKSKAISLLTLLRLLKFSLLIALLCRCAFSENQNILLAQQPNPTPPAIIDTHEHIQSVEQLPKLLGAMDSAGIEKTVLMGSSWFTITLNPRVGFTRYDWNNQQLIEIVKLHPDRFEAWPTLNPLDPNKLEKFKALVEAGATGLKLYAGHGYIMKESNDYLFHKIALDHATMFPVYKYCQDNFIPICLHVNPGPTKPGFAQEFVAVLDAFPDLKIICPHYMLSSIKDSRLREFLDTYPNLYTDISFGHDDFLSTGLYRISRDTEKFRGLFNAYPDRFLFAADLVVTEAQFKTQEWVKDRFQTYIDMLSKEKYTTPVAPGETLNGLALSDDILRGILRENFQKIMAKKPQGTKTQRKFDWSATGIQKIQREPGQAFRPPPARR